MCYFLFFFPISSVHHHTFDIFTITRAKIKPNSHQFIFMAIIKQKLIYNIITLDMIFQTNWRFNFCIALKWICKQMMFDSSLPHVVCRRGHVMSRYLCLLAYSGVQHMLCCVFALFFFVLCTLCCQLHCIVHFWLPFCYSRPFMYITVYKIKVS